MGERTNQRSKGFYYEAIAADYLKQKGLQILERNFYSRWGEIDLIAKEGEFLVFVEVKYRRSHTYGLPEEALTAKKRRSIYWTAQSYCLLRQIPDTRPMRFDLLAIEGEEIRYYKGAF